MAEDKVLSQAEIDALVSNAPQKPSPPPITSEAPVVSKPAESPPPAKQPEYDPLPARLARLESNYAIVKKELQAILLDLREKCLEAENPFKSPDAHSRTSTADTGKTEKRGE